MGHIIVLLDLSFKLDQKVYTSLIHKLIFKSIPRYFSRLLIMSQYDSTLFELKAGGRERLRCITSDTNATHMTVKNENSSIGATARINLWFTV